MFYKVCYTCGFIRNRLFVIISTKTLIMIKKISDLKTKEPLGLIRFLAAVRKICIMQNVRKIIMSYSCLDKNVFIMKD